MQQLCLWVARKLSVKLNNPYSSYSFVTVCLEYLFSAYYRLFEKNNKILKKHQALKRGAATILLQLHQCIYVISLFSFFQWYKDFICLHSNTFYFKPTTTHIHETSSLILLCRIVSNRIKEWFNIWGITFGLFSYFQRVSSHENNFDICVDLRK